jgi:NADH-quinone oxidoreductase subunit L
MAGPTPVSALIHAATMVTAGIYLIVRNAALFAASPSTSLIVVLIGAVTALWAALVGLKQWDIKKVLAYSTVSQLGLMFLALGVGAYGVAIFHVMTHAFFKACLFLGAGSVIHAMSGEQDIRRMGGLARKIPVTFATFAVSTAAIAGLPPLSGFFSKDEILWFAYGSATGGSPWLLLLASATALLTAFYMFRLLWLTFFGRPRMDEEVAHHIHESPWSMTGVLVVLALLAAFGGFFSIPQFLEPMLPLPAIRPAAQSFHGPLVWIATGLGVGGLLLAAYFYGNDAVRAAALRPGFEPVHRLLSGKYYIDELYDAVLGRPLAWISEKVFLRIGDRLLIDGSLNGLAALAERSAGRLSKMQTGNLHLYLFLVLAGLVGALVWSWRNG